MASDEFILGIDLGTTNSCVALVQGSKKPEIIRSSKGYMTIPSVVGLNKKGALVVGQGAVDQMITLPSNTIYGSKRLVGRPFESPVVQQMKTFFSYPIISGSDGNVAVTLGEKNYDLSQISAMILSEIRDFAQSNLGFEISQAVITVPAYYSDNQRQAVKTAGRLAGLEVKQIVNEPTAAAIAYGYNKSFKQTILVYDFGGGTFDVSILKIQDNSFEVLATGGDTFLGGMDIDNRLTAYVIEQFRKYTGKDLLGERASVQRIRNASERVKRDLSLQESQEIFLPYITHLNSEAVDLKMVLSRDKLEKLSGPLIERTLAICDTVLETQKMSHLDIDEVLLVGGQTRMPLVREMVEKHFNKKPRKDVHPDEAVALGAAILAGEKHKEAQVKLKDVLAIPIGIALKSGKFKEILSKNCPIPMAKAYKVLKKKNMELIIDVFQGEDAHVLHNEYLGTFRFDRTEDRDQQLELRFDLSAECILTVQARDLQTNKRSLIKMITLQSRPLEYSQDVGEANPENSKLSRLFGKSSNQRKN